MKNLYEILNVATDCSRRDIKKAYRKLVKKFHPDKVDGNAEIFEMVTNAYNILVNESSRKEYDRDYLTSRQSEYSFVDLKKASTEYYQGQKTNLTKKTKEESQVEFNKFFDEIDTQHNLNEEKFAFITENNANKRMSELESVRELNDIEDMHDRLFDNNDFDKDKFNMVWNKMHKTDQLVKHTGNPNPFNISGDGQMGFDSIDNFASIGDVGDVGAPTNDFLDDTDTIPTEFQSQNFDDYISNREKESLYFKNNVKNNNQNESLGYSMCGDISGNINNKLLLDE